MNRSVPQQISGSVVHEGSIGTVERENALSPAATLASIASMSLGETRICTAFVCREAAGKPTGEGELQPSAPHPAISSAAAPIPAPRHAITCQVQRGFDRMEHRSTRSNADFV
jgi:hypothetical protein